MKFCSKCKRRHNIFNNRIGNEKLLEFCTLGKIVELRGVICRKPIEITCEEREEDEEWMEEDEKVVF